MYAFKSVFYPDAQKIKLSKYIYELWSLGAELITGGQISDYNIIHDKNPKMVGFCHERGSLSRRHQSALAKKLYTNILQLSKTTPRITIIGVLADYERKCKCKKKRPLILDTDYITLESPITCGLCQRPVPIYRLKLSEDNLLGIKQWNQTYSNCESLFVGSGVGEYWGHKQMASFSSELSKEGYKLCRDIEKKTHNPTYYFLSKYYGQSKMAEEKRKCPKCRKKWFRRQPWHKYYHFKCDRCRLLSNIAWEV